MAFDKTFDNQRTYNIFLDTICKEVFGKRIEVTPTRGIDNIKWDMEVNNSKFNQPLNVEVKTRKQYFSDIAVEFTQYQDESKRWRKIRRRMDDGNINTEEAWGELKNNNTAWFWKSEADVILYVKPGEVLLFSKKSLTNYIYNNIQKLPEVYSDKTTGAYNILVPIVGKNSFTTYKKFDIDTRLYYSSYLN